GIDALPTLIPHAYRTTMLLGYVMNDLLRSYIGSGEFTQRGRVKDTLKEFAAFYVPFGLVSIVFLIYLLSSQGLTLTAVRMMVSGLF
ncbi:LMBR1 domain-containing protein, partial [Klebsiella pneumoniae]|uniref:LMBR1 domain-containing protein n=1 Tax=Klebsiella pneumoniae TaxID=573 RepID=UPI00259FF34A